MLFLKFAAVAHVAAAYEIAQHVLQDGAEQFGFGLAFVGSALVAYGWPRSRALVVGVQPLKPSALCTPVASGVRRIEVAS